jgi:hypothetical protein
MQDFLSLILFNVRIGNLKASGLMQEKYIIQILLEECKSIFKK